MSTTNGGPTFRGQVVWFNAKKGFGFIRPEAGGEDVFVHFSGILQEPDTYRTLLEKQWVEYQVVPGTKGPMAIEVRVIQPDGVEP